MIDYGKRQILFIYHTYLTDRKITLKKKTFNGYIEGMLKKTNARVLLAKSNT